jgi:DNA-binding NtrC family response regulator
MATGKSKILIIDEAGFSRICSAILEKEGYGTSAISDVRQIESILDYSMFGLVITSYPFCAVILDELGKLNVPTIVLSDRLNRDLVMALENFDKSLSYCMIKPLDYTKFRNLVSQVMRGDDSSAIQARIGGKSLQTDMQIKLQADQ